MSSDYEITGRRAAVNSVLVFKKSGEKQSKNEKRNGGKQGYVILSDSLDRNIRGHVLVQSVSVNCYRFSPDGFVLKGTRAAG